MVTERVREVLERRYVLGPKLGEGATAEVYAARDVASGAQRAIKILRRDVALEVGTERFLREVRVVERLSHPNVLPLIDSGDADGVPYHVMPMVGGETLRARLDRERQLPLADALRIARDVAAALDAAHALGIIHRDVKPENILLEGNATFVADFGIAYAMDAAAGDRITASGLTVGTPTYMSPEQASAERHLDARSDIYSLACVCYEMLSGQPPFTGATAQAIRARHATEPPPSIRHVRPSLSPAIESALIRGLAKSPADRPASAMSMVGELESGTVADALPAPIRARRRARELVLSATTVAVALSVWAIWFRRDEIEPARRWVLVADFTTPPDEPALGPAVRDLVATALGQSPVVSLVPVDQVTAARRNANMADSLPLDLPRAREIAVRTAVRVVLAGAVSKLGEHAYSVSLHAVNADDGATLFSDARAAEDSGMAFIRAVQDLTHAMRRQIGEHAQAVEATRPLDRVSTPSFAAYRTYEQAMTRSRAGDFEGSLPLLRRAVSLDPGFATAWRALGIVYGNLQWSDSAERAYRTALAYVDRLDDAERDHLRADVALNVDHDPEGALRWYDDYLAKAPMSVPGHTNRAAVLSALGRHAAALAEVETAMAINPLRVDPRQIALMNVAGELLMLGRVDSARRVLPRLGGAQAQYIHLLVLAAEARWDSLAAMASAIAADPSAPRYARFPATTASAAAWAALGDTARASTALGQAMASAHGADARWFVSARLLYDYARGAAVRWRLPDDIARDSTVEGTYVRGLFGAVTGRGREVAAARAALASRSHRDLARIGYGAVLLAALDTLARGDTAAASTMLERPADEGEHQPFTTDRTPTYWLRVALLRAVGSRGPDSTRLNAARRAMAGEGIPAVHLPLRGFTWPAASRSIAAPTQPASRAARR